MLLVQLFPALLRCFLPRTFPFCSCLVWQRCLCKCCFDDISAWVGLRTCWYSSWCWSLKSGSSVFYAMKWGRVVFITLSAGSSSGTSLNDVVIRAWRVTGVAKNLLSKESVPFFQCVAFEYVTVFDVVFWLTSRTRLVFDHLAEDFVATHNIWRMFVIYFIYMKRFKLNKEKYKVCLNLTIFYK